MSRTPILIKRILLASATLLSAQALSIAPAQAATTGFNPGAIIDDSVFTNKGSMSVAQIQQFLNSKVPVCDTDHPRVSSTPSSESAPWRCLKDYHENPTTGENNLDGRPVPAGGKSAAQIIYDVAQQYSINPQVLIVTLQKEQGLVTDTWPYDRQFRTAMGFACPDTAPCDPNYFGFYKQMNQAGRHFRNFYDENPNWTIPYKVGSRYVQYHPNSGCGGTSVNITTHGTAALYNYTPYQPNSASLAAGFGVGDSCSSYGNRNFFNYFNSWFGPTTGSPLIQVPGNDTVYLRWGSYRYGVPSFEILKAYGLAQHRITSVSESYLAELTAGPSLAKAAKFGSDPTVYLVDGGRKHPIATPEIANAYGIVLGTEAVYDTSLNTVTADAAPLSTVARRADGAIFLIESGKKRLFPDQPSYTSMGSPAYSTRPLSSMSNVLLGGLPDGAPILMDGKVVKAPDSPAIYLFDKGMLLPFSAASFAQWGSQVDYPALPSSGLAAIPSGSSAPTKVRSATGAAYAVDRGTKRLFSADDFQAWNQSIAQYAELSDNALARLQTRPIPKLVQGSAPAVFQVRSGKRHPFPTVTDLTASGYSFLDKERLGDELVGLLPEGSPAFGPGSLVRLPTGAVLFVDKNLSCYSIPSIGAFNAYGFRWERVRNVAENGAADCTASGDLSQLIKNADTGAFSLIDGGTHHVATSDDAAAYGFTAKPHNTYSGAAIAAIPKGAPLYRYVQGTGAAVYLIENGQKRLFTSEKSFYDQGGNWSRVSRLNDAFIESLPTGNPL